MTKQSPLPVHTFAVDTGQDWKQKFEVMKEDRGLRLYVTGKRGRRDVGQAEFPTPYAAERWAKCAVTCNGPFDIY